MATWAATATFTDGVLLSSTMNTYVRDPIDFEARKPIARLRQTVAQSIPASTFTPITFTTEDIDSDPAGTGGHSTSVNTSRWVCQYAGWYLFAGGVGWAANAVGRRICAWFINGTIISGSQMAGPTTAGFDCEITARVEFAYLNAGDYVELTAYQESGGALLTIVTAGTQSSANILRIRSDG
jgi:hypothetical protein